LELRYEIPELPLPSCIHSFRQFHCAPSLATTQHAAQQPTLLAAFQALAERSKTQTLQDTVQTKGPKQAIDKTTQSKSAQLLNN
jgi:hypothetical protein